MLFVTFDEIALCTLRLHFISPSFKAGGELWFRELLQRINDNYHIQDIHLKMILLQFSRVKAHIESQEMVIVV